MLCVERANGGANSPDEIASLTRIQRLPKPADMDIYGARIDVRIMAPDSIEQPLAGEHPARMLEKMFQQPELGRSKRDLLASAAHAVRCDVHFEVSVCQLLAGQRRTNPAKHRANASNELARAERLGHIIVSAGFEATDSVALFAARGEHHNRNVGGGRAPAQPPAHFDAADPLDHPV